MSSLLCRRNISFWRKKWWFSQKLTYFHISTRNTFIMVIPVGRGTNVCGLFEASNWDSMAVVFWRHIWLPTEYFNVLQHSLWLLELDLVQFPFHHVPLLKANYVKPAIISVSNLENEIPFSLQQPSYHRWFDNVAKRFLITIFSSRLSIERRN